MSCWKCGSGQHLAEIQRYPASEKQIRGVGGTPDAEVSLGKPFMDLVFIETSAGRQAWIIVEDDQRAMQMMNAEDRPEEERMTRVEAEALASKMINLLQPYADSIDVCGSYRRGREDPGDLDIVVILKPRVTLPEVVENLANEYTAVNWVGEKKTQMVIDGVKVDVRTTTPRAKGAALLYFTGPAGYNIGIRRSAKSRGMKLNEYGIFDRETNEYLGGATEEEIYEILGKNFRPATERRAEEEEVVTEIVSPLNENVTRSLWEIPDNVLRYMYRRGDISKMQMEIGIGMKMQAEEFRAEENVSFATEENNEMQEAIIRGLRNLARDGYVVAASPYGNRSRNFYQYLSTEIMSELAELGSDDEGPEVTGSGRAIDPYNVVRSLARNQSFSMPDNDNNELSVGIADMVMSFTQQSTMMDEQDGFIPPEGYTRMVFDLPYEGRITRRLGFQIAFSMGIRSRAGDELILFSTPQKNRNCSMITNMLIEDLQPEVSGMTDLEKEQFYQEFGMEIKRQVFYGFSDFVSGPIGEEFERNKQWVADNYGTTTILENVTVRDDIKDRAVTAAQRLNPFAAEEVQEFNAMVKAPKGWDKAGITEKVMMREVMMQEARLQEALLELETNIRMGLISEKQAMAMFAKLLG